MVFVRRDEPISHVEIKAQVRGYLGAVQFTEGALVKEDAPVYRIKKGFPAGSGTDPFAREV
jgi:hypothetical protein